MRDIVGQTLQIKSRLMFKSIDNLLAIYMIVVDNEGIIILC